jgi:hypothetical protein
MRKFMSLVLMGSLLGGSGFVMAQTVPGVDQTVSLRQLLRL